MNRDRLCRRAYSWRGSSPWPDKAITPPELRERAVRMVLDHAAEHPSQWAAIRLVGEKLGCSVEALRRWVRQAERDGGQRPGLTTDERQRLKQLKRENFELKRANEILRKASAFSRRRSSTADGNDGGVHRRPSEDVRVEPICRVLPIAPSTYSSAQITPSGSDPAFGAGATRRRTVRDHSSHHRGRQGLRIVEGHCAQVRWSLSTWYSPGTGGRLGFL